MALPSSGRPSAHTEQLLQVWIGTHTTLRVAALFLFASGVVLVQRAFAPPATRSRTVATRRRTSRHAPRA